ncbi:MAG: insulinase family protein [Candidatus Krumholzibacteria bacterium]|nr:insulinase family protein [Candidatus Krumholzibacteria bacterium]
MKRTVSLAAALLLAVAAHGVAGTAGTIEYTEHTLANGLRVVLSEDHSVPVVAVNVWYHVGSANEEPGRSGFAHLFEHMMFEGSENLDKGDHFKHISRAGGSMNGSTTTDRTNYYEVLPANRLNLGLWLEADRMRALAITEENFENQRETVKEERRQRVDNEPYGAAFMVADTLGYDGWPYNHTVIGSMDDLNAAEVGDVQAFFDRYYCPSNAVLVVVGDINLKKTMEMVEEYFGDIPAGSPSTFPQWDEPMSKGERREVVDSPKANVPASFVSYQIPLHDHADTPALELLADLLTDGESSRLHKRLVKDEEAAFGVWGYVEGRLGPSRVMLIVAANAGREIAECESLMFEELERVKQEGLGADELEKLKTNFKTEFVGSRQTVMRKAEELQHYVRFHPDIAEVNSDLEAFMAVTAADIQRVANTYLRENNRTVVVAMPPSS